MLAVTDHDGAGKIVAARRLERGLDDAHLFARFLVARGRAADGVEVGRKTEVLQNALGHGVELRRGNEKTLALTLEMRKQRGNAGIGSVVEPAVLLIVFAEFCDRGVDILCAHKVREGLAERRADEKRQLAPVAFDAERTQGILSGFHDAGAGVGQRAVQIK